MKFFYSHLIEIEPLFSELDQMDLAPQEKMYLSQLIDANIHQAVLDAIFSQLSPQEKIIFIEHLRNDDQDKLWKLLNKSVEAVEDKIKQAVHEAKRSLHQDLKEARRLK